MAIQDAESPVDEEIIIRPRVTEFLGIPPFSELYTRAMAVEKLQTGLFGHRQLLFKDEATQAKYEGAFQKGKRYVLFVAGDSMEALLTKNQ